MLTARPIGRPNLCWLRRESRTGHAGGFVITPAGRYVTSLELNIANIRGLTAQDFTAPTLYLDSDGSGNLSSGDTALSTGVVEATASGCVLRFSQPFQTNGNYLVWPKLQN